MIDTRRSFLTRMAAFAGVLVAAPEVLLGNGAAGRKWRWRKYLSRSGMPNPPSGPLPPEFWNKLRDEFQIPRTEAFFNTGTLGSSPRIVQNAVIEHMNHVDRDIAHWDYKADHEQYFWGYFPEKPLREKIAKLINASSGDEIALTQNATFGLNFMANGLDIGPGEEILVDEGSHPGGRCGWELRDKRYGGHVRYLHVPTTPKDPQELIDLYEKGTKPQTKVWMMPHLTSGTAIRFPVAELCKRARERGIISVVDGAQTCGHLAIDVQAMGCDAYFTSPHKWLLAPKGTGFLYVRKDALPRVWTTLASTEWDNYSDGALRLMQYGTGNLSLLVGLDKAIDFHTAIGSVRIEERILGLADRLRAGLKQIPRAVVSSPLHPELRSATTIWGLNGVTGADLQDKLWDTAKVRVRSVGPNSVRQCCHIYNSEEEVDRTLATAREIAAAAPSTIKS
jgi:isopenicillin-N epimerase